MSEKVATGTVVDRPPAVEREAAPSGRKLSAYPDVAKIVAIFGIVTIHVAAVASEGFGVLTDRAWGAPVLLETVLEHVQAIYSGQPYYHLYFLFVIGGLYLIAPLLAGDQRHGPAPARAPLGWGAGPRLPLDGVPPWLPGTGSNAFSLFAPYIGFFLAGRCLGRAKLDPELALWSAAAFLVLLVSTFFEAYLWVHAEGLEYGRYFYGYLSPPVILMSLAIFVVIRYLTERREQRKPVRHMKALHFVAQATFGVFLIHPYFFTWFQRHYARPPPCMT